MKDLVFSAATVDAALAVAADTLGLERGRVRYVVLDAGTEACGKTPPRAARIAVLVDSEIEGAGEPARPAEDAGDLSACLGMLAAALGRATGLRVRFEVADDEEAVTIRVAIDDEGFLWGEQGEVFPALEHVLRKAAGRFVVGRPVTVRDPAYRERRDEALRQQARDVAAEVRRDGRQREMKGLNSYERRIVHMALADEVGVRTRSVGGGDERTLLVEPAEPEIPDQT